MILIRRDGMAMDLDVEKEQFHYVCNETDNVVTNFKCTIEKISLSELARMTYEDYTSYSMCKLLDNTGLGLVKNEKVIIVDGFKTEDKDLMLAIFNGDVHPVIAEAIKIGRDIYEKHGYSRKTVMTTKVDESPCYEHIKINLEDNPKYNKQVNPCYKHYKIPKKEKGKFRDIYEPEENLKEIMKIINFKLEKFFLKRQKRRHTNQYAYIKERNIKYNANIHRNNKTIVKVDISKFFDNIKFDYIKRYLKFLCRDELLLNEFKQLIINPKTGGLFMGNPISGTLGNHLMYKISIALENIFNKKGLDVSIYSDDITVSARDGSKISKELVTNIINYVFKFYKLDDIKLKESKTKTLSNQNRRICGVSINHNNQLTVKRSEYEKLRVLLYKLSKNEEIDIPISTLKGKIAFYLYIDETGKFERLLNKYKDLKIK